MPTCPHLERCLLRQASGMRAFMEVWQGFYCEDTYHRCERYKLAADGLDVPTSLLPNGKLLEGPDAMIAGGAKPTD